MAVSDKIKSLRGTDQPCRMRTDAPAPDALEELPDHPDWLPNPEAVAEYKRLGAVLVANRILTAADLTTLEHAAALHGKIVKLWQAQETPTGHMYSQLRGFLSDLGLSPAARGKVKAAEGGKKPKNAFEGNGKRPRK